LPDGNYRDFLTVLRSVKNKTRVVVTSRLADWDEYLEAMRLGAFDVIAAPCHSADVEWILVQAARDLRESAISWSNSGSHRAASAS
jgi:DNA-binding NtrC family response regulator